MKKRVEKEDFCSSEVLISYYDNGGDVRIIKMKSIYALDDMVVMGLPKDLKAVKLIGEGTDFVLNIMGDSFDDDSKDESYDMNCGFKSIKGDNIETYRSDNIIAPVILESVLSIECTPYQVVVNEQFDSVVNIISKIKGYLK